MQHNRHKESCYSKQVGHYDSIIRINILGSDSLDAYTCDGLYCLQSHCQWVSPYHTQGYPWSI